MAIRVPVPDEAVLALAPWYGTLPQEVRVLRGSVLGWLFGLTGQHAVTINGTIHWTKHATPLAGNKATALLGHELFHVVQQQEMGWWRFLTGYIWHWRPKHVRRGWEHPYEVPAYARGSEISSAIQNA